MDPVSLILRRYTAYLSVIAPGAIVVEWNAAQPSGQQGGAGMWDSHIRLGGAAGTNLETNCPQSGSGGTTNCFAAYMALHLTAGSTAYLEVRILGIYAELLLSLLSGHLGLVGRS